MQQNQNIINPDVVCQAAIQAKLNMYQAKENYDSFLKFYNEEVNNLVNLINIMKKRILDLETELKNKDEKKPEKKEANTG